METQKKRKVRKRYYTRNKRFSDKYLEAYTKVQTTLGLQILSGVNEYKGIVNLIGHAMCQTKGFKIQETIPKYSGDRWIRRYFKGNYRELLHVFNRITLNVKLKNGLVQEVMGFYRLTIEPDSGTVFCKFYNDPVKFAMVILVSMHQNFGIASILSKLNTNTGQWDTNQSGKLSFVKKNFVGMNIKTSDSLLYALNKIHLITQIVSYLGVVPVYLSDLFPCIDLDPTDPLAFTIDSDRQSPIYRKLARLKKINNNG